MHCRASLGSMMCFRSCASALVFMTWMYDVLLRSAETHLCVALTCGFYGFGLLACFRSSANLCRVGQDLMYACLRLGRTCRERVHASAVAQRELLLGAFTHKFGCETCLVAQAENHQLCLRRSRHARC